MTHFPIDYPVPPRVHEAPDLNRLKSYLLNHAPELGKITEVRQYPSGYSNLTFLLHTTTIDLILRRPPIGANIKSAHDMGREFQVLKTLFPHYTKIPRPILLCEDINAIGASFYIMERMEGTILRASATNKLQIDKSVFRKISEALVDNLVELHQLNIYTTGLDKLGKPEGYVQRQVEGWAKRYFNAETDLLDHMNLLAGWLPKNIPQSPMPAFLHNDYKYDNVILNPGNLSQIIGVLDWEMATVGDPLMDLGACLAYWSEATDDPVLQSFNLTSLPGNLTRQEFASRYSERSNRDLTNIIFYYVFGLFKNAVIAQQIYYRWKQGHSQDPRFGGLLLVIKSLAKHGVNTLNKNSL